MAFSIEPAAIALVHGVFRHTAHTVASCELKRTVCLTQGAPGHAFIAVAFFGDIHSAQLHLSMIENNDFRLCSLAERISRAHQKISSLFLPFLVMMDFGPYLFVAVAPVHAT